MGTAADGMGSSGVVIAGAVGSEPAAPVTGAAVAGAAVGVRGAAVA